MKVYEIIKVPYFLISYYFIVNIIKLKSLFYSLNISYKFKYYKYSLVEFYIWNINIQNYFHFILFYFILNYLVNNIIYIIK